MDPLMRPVNECEVTMFDTATFTMNDSKNKSGIQIKRLDIHGTKKESAVEDHHFIGNLSPEVSMFKRCLPKNDRSGLKTGFYNHNPSLVQNEKRDYLRQPKSEILTVEHCLKCFERIINLDIINGSNVNTDLEDEAYFKFNGQLTPEVSVYSCVPGTSEPTDGVWKQMRKKSINTKNRLSAKKRFGNRKNVVSASITVCKCTANSIAGADESVGRGDFSRCKPASKTFEVGSKYMTITIHTVNHENPTLCPLHY